MGFYFAGRTLDFYSGNLTITKVFPALSGMRSRLGHTLGGGRLRIRFQSWEEENNISTNKADIQAMPKKKDKINSILKGQVYVGDI